MDTEAFDQVQREWWPLVNQNLSGEEIERLNDYMEAAQLWVEPYLQAIVAMRHVETSADLALSQRARDTDFLRGARTKVGDQDEMMQIMEGWKTLVRIAGTTVSAAERIANRYDDEETQPSN